MAAGSHSGGDDAKTEADQRPDIDAGAGKRLEVVRLVLLGHGDLQKGLELRAVATAAGRLLDIGLDIGEAQNRRERGARDAPCGALPLPVRQPVALQALD